MTFNFVRHLSVAALLLLSSAAHSAPAQLYNKTLVVTGTINVSAVADDGTPNRGTRTFQRTIYISTKGRVFIKLDRRAGRFGDTREIAPNDARNTFRFQGPKLVGVIRFPSGAAQLAISFDSSFGSCNPTMIFGRESGKPIRYRGLNGKMYTQQGAFSVSGLSCSIRDGNPFAQ